jgi:hypothetical protein
VIKIKIKKIKKNNICTGMFIFTCQNWLEVNMLDNEAVLLRLNVSWKLSIDKETINQWQKEVDGRSKELRRWKEWKTKASKAEWVLQCEVNGPNTATLEYNIGL